MSAPTGNPVAPRGKGVFIWQLKNCGGGTPAGLVQSLRSIGATWVALKAADGAVKFNQRWTLTGYVDDLIQPAVKALKEAGIGVWLWQYVYLANPSAEAQVLLDRIDELKPDGVIIDAEADAKNRPTQAGAYMTKLRTGYKGAVGLCSYRYPSYHPELPWKQFLAACDFHMPQVYWVGAANPAEQLSRSIKELRGLKDMPISPVGAAYYEAGWRPGVAQINEFDQAVKANGLTSISWWVLDKSEGIEKFPEYAAAIGGHVWGTLEPSEIDLLKKRMGEAEKNIDWLYDASAELLEHLNALAARVKALEEAAKPPAVPTVTATVIADRANARFQYSMNGKGYPLMKIYPSDDEADIGKRVQFEHGERVEVLPEKIRTDGMIYYWQIAGKLAPVPLYLQEKDVQTGEQ